VRIISPARQPYLLSLIAIFILSLTNISSARTWNVNASGTGDVPTIQAAIDAAGNGDEIVVAPGTYTWASQGHTDDYGMIYFETYVGGFTLRSSGGPEVTILDAQYQGRVMFIQAHNDIVVDGFTFVNGVAPVNYDAGGGLIGHLASPVIRNCIFTGNSAQQGGGFWFGGVSAPVVEDCLFYGNRAYYGGGVFLINSSTTGTFTDCVIRDNEAESRGGGLMVHNYNFKIEDSAICANISLDSGGGITVSQSEPGVITHCTISENDADDGGSIQLMAEANIKLNCSIISNSYSGGAISLWEGTVIDVENSVFWNNAGGDSIPEGGIDSGNNLVIDPQFCGTIGSGNWKLQTDSPCLRRNHPTGFLCNQIGTYRADCGTVGTEKSSWGAIRNKFRK
jgi:hypothetical protein